MFRELKGQKKTVSCIVYASGGLVGWIVLAWYVTGCNAADMSSRFEESVDMLENGVDGSVVVPADAPSFNDAGVVSM